MTNDTSAQAASRSPEPDALPGIHSTQPQTLAYALTGVAVFPDDFLSIRRFAERANTNIVHWSEFDRGGHFAVMQVPDLLIGDTRAFFEQLR